MREILFRAKQKDWRKLPKEEWWIEGHPVKYQPSASKDEWIYGIVPVYASALYIIEIDPETLCQYTGLKDKNGNWIWENDIVRLGEDEYLLIKWSERYAGWCLQQNKWMFEHFFGEAVDEGTCKVVGNIFDHAELLKGE